jgi:hypothetical protein
MATIYRIRDWEKTFENHRTRPTKGAIRWIPIPNDFSGDGYTDLVTHTHGPAHYGIWIATAALASRCDPRGTLIRKNGEPHTPQTVARITQMKVSTVKEAWQRFITIGWLEAWKDAQVPAQLAQDGQRASGDTSHHITSQDKTRHHRTWTDDDLERIWKLYPKKDGKAEGLEEMDLALRRIASEVKGWNGTTLEADWMTVRVMDYARRMERKESKYILHACRYFKKKRYLDDPGEHGPKPCPDGCKDGWIYWGGDIPRERCTACDRGS